MELDRFLAEVAEAPPTGVDLDAAGEIIALDMQAKWGDAQAQPDWRALQAASLAALEQSRDLRPAAFLTASLLHTEGVGAFCDGVTLLRGLTEAFWDDLYPRPDEDGDVTERANALFNLTNFHKVLKPLRTTPLVEDRAAGRFSLLEVEIAEGRAEPPEDYEGDPPQSALVEAAFKAADPAVLQALEGATARAMHDLEAIEALFRERSGATEAPDMARLRDGLRKINAAIGARAPAASAGASTPAPTADTPGPGGAVAPALNGEIRNRQDAIGAMERIAQYFRAHEPSSPVPLLMERSKRLVDMDFLAILQDVAPDAVEQVKKLRGTGGEEQA